MIYLHTLKHKKPRQQQKKLGIIKKLRKWHYLLSWFSSYQITPH